MEYADEKRRLYESLVRDGATSDEIPYGNIPVPEALTQKWIRNFYASSGDVRLSETPRLLNRFCLGADPEFAFFDANKRYIHAETLGMDTLAAFGCDMAGRQAELRAKPSRSALDVVASLMEALRWLAATCPVSALKWSATPYVEDNEGHKDGCGGHVHIGRKRPGQELEVVKLDTAYSMLQSAGIFDAEGTKLRLGRTKFGRRGDIRPQTHGYEYRSFPTWISDPWVAYLTLVVSKLLVLHRGVIKSSAEKAPQAIKNLLCFYKSLDDDALIAWKAMQVLGMPKYSNKDKREAWGVHDGLYPTISLESCYIPSMIAPAQRTRQELFDWFTRGTPIKRSVAVSTWEPVKLPTRFHKVRVQPHVFNIPDVAMGLVSRGVKVVIQASNWMTFETNMPLPQAQIRKRLSSIVHPNAIQFTPDDGEYLTIGLPNGMRESKAALQELKSILADSSLFPICRVEDIGTTDWSKWDKCGVADKKVALLGRKLTTVSGQREGF